MTTKTASINSTNHSDNSSILRLMTMMTWIAWVVLGIGVLLCMMNLNQFNDRNTSLMVGIGFLVASVNIFFIGTAIGLVSERRSSKYEKTDQENQ
jgi:Na+/phosphate symporter